MGPSKREGARWGRIALGWLVAVLTGIMISPILPALFNPTSEPPGERGEPTAAAVAFLVSGFLVYLVGGYAAARLAGYPGGLNGAMTAVFGMILGVILTAFGLTFALGVALPPVIFGFGGAAWLAILIPFLVNLFGGFVGGKLGEPSSTDGVRRAG